MARSFQALKMQNKADMKVIKVWRNMSVLQLADAMEKDLGTVQFFFLSFEDFDTNFLR